MTRQLPVLNNPDFAPQRIVSQLPVIDANMYEHVGRYAGSVVVAAFHMIGGVERFAEWCDANPTSFYEKIWAKLPQKSTAVSVSGTVTLDDAITRLESQTIEADYEEVEPTYDL